MSALLEIQDLMVFYENALAINKLTLHCQEGKITGIFGYPDHAAAG